MPRTTLPLLIAAALGLAAGAATAAPAPEESTSIRVRVADVDLSTETGARVALRRITRAADTVCGDEADSRDLQRRAVFETCVRGVVDQTVAQAHSPVLAALNGTQEHARLAAAN